MPNPAISLSQLLTFAQDKKASDLHLSANQPIMMRLRGQMVSLDLPILNNQEIKTLIAQAMNDEQYQQWQTNLELDFGSTIAGIRCRVNAFYQLHGAAAVFRLIHNHIPSLASLQLPPTLAEISQLDQGLVLVTGATGSGKSTTLAALIDHINSTTSKHILTIEDPIEFIHTSKKSLINQRQLQEHTHSFHTALRSALREDPDVILIGELRDLQTIRLALTAAETGHLVLATLHTNGAAQSIHRLIDVFSADEKQLISTMLSESLQMIISQKLIPSLDGSQVAACEILKATSAVRNLIRENKIAQLANSITTGSQFGMVSFESSIKTLIAQGKLDPAILKSPPQ